MSDQKERPLRGFYGYFGMVPDCDRVTSQRLAGAARMSARVFPFGLTECVYFLALFFVFILSGCSSLKAPVSPNTETPSSGIHSSFSAHKSFFDDIFQKTPQVASAFGDKIPAVIVNHHLLAPTLITQTLRSVAHLDPSVVVVISPNHFGIGSAPLLTSRYDWQTQYGILSTDTVLVSEIEKLPHVKVDEQPFAKEHGVFNIVTFIHKVFPNARIVPIIIKDQFTDAEASVFAQQLDRVLPDDALVVGSFDFSHYLPQKVADFHDRQSLSVLQHLASSDTKRLDIDSRPGLNVVIRYATLRGAVSFQPVEQSSSAEIIGDSDTQENTSYIVGYFSDTVMSNPASSVTLLAVGDIFPIPSDDERFHRFLQGVDVTLTDPSSSNEQDVFFQSMSITRSSADYSIRGRNINLLFFDDKNGSFTDFLNEVRRKKVIPSTVVISVRWRETLDQNEQQKMAHAMIEAGADVIFGMGATIQPLEVYNNHPIFYSLGDLDPDGDFPQETLAVGMELSDNEPVFLFFPLIQQTKGHPYLPTKAESDIILSRFSRDSLLSLDMRQELVSGNLILSW